MILVFLDYTLIIEKEKAKTMKWHLIIIFFLTATTIIGQTYPDQNWEYLDEPEKEGWDRQGLRELQKYIVDSTSLTGLMIVHKGKVAYDYGDIEEVSYIASCRKSVLAMLYGKYVKDGTIVLHKTLAELGIDDVEPLSDKEKRATIKDLISARSGVFHKASNGGDLGTFAPQRNTKVPGEFWLYNNWDFNVAGYVFEQETRKNIYDEVEGQLAIPLGMQDWDRSIQQKSGDAQRSRYPAYHMWFSTRDMARIGYLMLRKGKWKNQQLIDAAWVKEMTAASTTYDEVKAELPELPSLEYFEFDYGYMWWLFNKEDDPRFKGAYTAFGAYGQAIAVFPAIDVVVAFKTHSKYRRSNNTKKRLKVLRLAVGALKQ